MNAFPTYILVSGYGWTGSSAVVDLLKEINKACYMNVEFRIIKDPKGLRDLYDSLVENWDPLNSDIAIKDFLWLANHLNYKRHKFSLNAGLGYVDFFGKSFIE